MKPILVNISINILIIILQISAVGSCVHASPAEAHKRTTGLSGADNHEAGMVRIPKGTFHMGCKDCRMPDSLPIHVVELDSFWIDETPVTNAAYARFAKVRHSLIK